MIFTKSSFLYGHDVTINNRNLPFSELFDIPSPKLAELRIGSYAASDFVVEIARALNAVAAQDYTVSMDRDTGFITITAALPFELLAGTGDTIGIDIYNLMGFEIGSDFTASISYTSTFRSGSIYLPQVLLQDYRALDDNEEANLSKVHTSAEGVVQTVSFGIITRVKFRMTLITNRKQAKGSPVREDSTGLEKARAFLSYVTKKRPIEMIKDITDNNTFDTILLESTENNNTGVGWELEELYGNGLVDHYDTGLLTFRRVVL